MVTYCISRSYLTGVTAVAELQWHLSNVKEIWGVERILNTHIRESNERGWNTLTPGQLLYMYQPMLCQFIDVDGSSWVAKKELLLDKNYWYLLYVAVVLFCEIFQL